MFAWLIACAMSAAPGAALSDAPAWPTSGVSPAAAPAPPATRALPRKGQAARPAGDVPRSGRSAPRSRSRQEVLATTGASLAVVVGLFLIAAWTLRGRGGGRGLALPSEAVETLGRFTLGARQNVHLVRCGSKLLLVAVSPSFVETLTEITDPREVNHLLTICQRSSPHGATAAFRDVLERLGRERAPLA